MVRSLQKEQSRRRGRPSSHEREQKIPQLRFGWRPEPSPSRRSARTIQCLRATRCGRLEAKAIMELRL